MGRFVSPDSFVQEPDNPQNLNRYSYVLNNPVNLVDPTGHFFSFIFGIIKAIMAAIMEAVIAVLEAVFTIPAAIGAGEGGVTLGHVLGAVSFGAQTAHQFGAFDGGVSEQPSIIGQPSTKTGSPVIQVNSTPGPQESSGFELDSGRFFEDGEGNPVLTASLVRQFIKRLLEKILKRGKTPPKPTEGQIRHFERQLERHGRKSLEKSQKSIEKNLEDEYRRMEQYKRQGGHTSSMERDIERMERDLEAIKEVLRRHP